MQFRTNDQMQNTEVEFKKQRRPRGRSERMVATIHQTTYELLLTTDYEDIEKGNHSVSTQIFMIIGYFLM